MEGDPNLRSTTTRSFSLGLVIAALFTSEARPEPQPGPGIGPSTEHSPTFLGSGDGSISWIDSGGATELIPYNGRRLELYDGKLYLLDNREVTVIDLETGARHNIPIPPTVEYVLNFTVLPDSSIALLDNRNDRVDFLDPTGDHLATVAMPIRSKSQWQNLAGVVVDRRLILSEDGYQRLLAIDLDSYDVSVFWDLKHIRRYPLGALG